MTSALAFRKFQGAGNDFVLIDNRDSTLIVLSENERNKLCCRKYGVGADGILEILSSSKAHFKLIYYNSNGRLTSFCGNGSRCSISYFIQVSDTRVTDVSFECNDVIYNGGHVYDENLYYICMTDVPIKNIVKYDHDNYFVDTGSPHHVRFVNDLDSEKIEDTGACLCYGQYGLTGCNINFCTSLSTGVVRARTFERGVDAETLACGTGATAIAIIVHVRDEPKTGASTGKDPNKLWSYDIQMPGGKLTVQFTVTSALISNLKLIGPAQEVFRGIFPR